MHGRAYGRTWFRWAGELSTAYAVKLLGRPTFTRARWRGESHVVSGRSGDRFSTDGTHDTFELKMRIRCPESKINEVTAWLMGSGMLEFSWQIGKAYDARIDKGYSFIRVVPGVDPLLEADITWTCQPFLYSYPEPVAKAYTNGSIITNPGTAASLPRVTIVGSGSFDVTIAGQTVHFDSISGGVIVDSDIGDAFSTSTPPTLLNRHVDGELWTIPPGDSTIEWDLEAGASITSVTILPRWRWE